MKPPSRRPFSILSVPLFPTGALLTTTSPPRYHLNSQLHPKILSAKPTQTFSSPNPTTTTHPPLNPPQPISQPFPLAPEVSSLITQSSPFPLATRNPYQASPKPVLSFFQILQTRPFSPFGHNPPQKPLELISRSVLFNPNSPLSASRARPISSIGEKPSQESQEVAPGSMDPGSSPIRVWSTLASPFDGSSPPMDASSSIRKPISLWPGAYHSPVTNALWEARSSIFERLLMDNSKDAPAQAELLTRTPSQSRTSIIYNFSSDYILREQYRDPWNEVRIGKLLEDLDALAGTIAVKHCADDDSTTRPLLLVTASVDKMVLKKPLRVDTDLKISGAVTWVGRSSIEIQIEVTQSQQENSVPSDVIALTANFTFVARDSKTGKSAPVNRLMPETEKEKLLFKEGEARDNLRKRKREEQRREFENGRHSIHGEVERLKSLLAEGRVFCDLPALADRDSILMRDTCLENSLICQPQQRNLHGRIFGGFLMHLAFELAFSTAYAFVGQMPCFLEVDHVDFLKPVDVGNFLRFKSCVLYTQKENPEQPLINIEVVAHVTRPELRTSEVSNTFYFTFTVNSNALKNGLRIRNVVPATEEEARRVLERMDSEKIYS